MLTKFHIPHESLPKKDLPHFQVGKRKHPVLPTNLMSFSETEKINCIINYFQLEALFCISLYDSFGYFFDSIYHCDRR